MRRKTFRREKHRTTGQNIMRIQVIGCVLKPMWNKIVLLTCVHINLIVSYTKIIIRISHIIKETFVWKHKTYVCSKITISLIVHHTIIVLFENQCFVIIHFSLVRISLCQLMYRLYRKTQLPKKWNSLPSSSFLMDTPVSGKEERNQLKLKTRQIN